jgi:DNA-binding MarR family transcriptional regulator
MSVTTNAILPYAGTSGWSGTHTSEERARSNDSDGTTGKTQHAVMIALEHAAYDGLTWRDLAELLGTHHGTASGALSVLHKAGKIARLSERRNRCKVYVHLDNVWGRETEQAKSNAIHACPNCGHEL